MFGLKWLTIIGILVICSTATSDLYGNDSQQVRRIRFLSTRNNQKVTLQLVTRFGTLNNRSRRILSELARPKDTTTRTVLLHPKLFLMLQRVADQFPGNPIEIISGHRLGDKEHSDSHNMGRAVDFRVLGTKSEKLYDFVQTLPKCGTGHYPKSDFVHLDVREESATWIDYFHSNKDCRLVRSKEEVSGRSIEFVVTSNDKKATLQLVSESGAINNRNRQILSQLAGSKVRATRVALLHPRLILMLQRVADQFPGHKFELISGYRPSEKGFHSYHSYGRAMDFRLSGVDNKKLYEFVRTLPKCGTGYYPNSVFIHLDVRDSSATWTDLSGVGEKAQYIKRKKRK